MRGGAPKRVALSVRTAEGRQHATLRHWAWPPGIGVRFKLRKFIIRGQYSILDHLQPSKLMDLKFHVLLEYLVNQHFLQHIKF